MSQYASPFKSGLTLQVDRIHLFALVSIVTDSVRPAVSPVTCSHSFRRFLAGPSFGASVLQLQGWPSTTAFLNLNPVLCPPTLAAGRIASLFFLPL